MLGAVVAIVLLQAPGCRARPLAGEKCKAQGQLVCASGDRALICDSGAWVDVPCKGPRGCARAGGGAGAGNAPGGLDQCDDTVAAEADPCPRNPPLDYACSVDRAEALVCKDGQFALWRRCRGPAGCEVGAQDEVHCDTSAGESGDPCEKQLTYSCSRDGKTMLVCEGSALAPASSCRGKAGCHVDAATHKVDCDDEVAEAGDPCDEPRRITCAVDHKVELVCSAGGGEVNGAHADAGAPLHAFGHFT